MCSDCHDDDDDDGISLKSTSNIVFVSAVLLKYAQAFMTKQSQKPKHFYKFKKSAQIGISGLKIKACLGKRE